MSGGTGITFPVDSRRICTHPLGGGAVWTPADLGALYEADWDAMSGITITSGRVSGWADKTTNGHDGVQANAADQPVVASGVANGLDAVLFAIAGTEFLTLAAALGGTAGHLFAIVKGTTDSGVNTGPPVYAGSAAPQSYFPFTNGTIYESFGSTTRQTTSNPAATLVAFNCYEVVSASGRFTNRLNGVELYATGTNTVGWAAVQKIGGGPSVYFDGWIARAIVCGAELTGANLVSMRAYLTATYGVAFP